MININIQEKETLIILAARLKAARLSRNESQEIFAQRLGLSRQSYSKMENGLPGTPIGYWLKASSLLGLLDSWQKVIAEDDDLFRLYEQQASHRQRATPKKRTGK